MTPSGDTSNSPGRVGDRDRDRDADGRARNQRPRDGLGRPMDHGATGAPPVADDLTLDADQTLAQAQHRLDDDQPFQAHEILEARWKTGPSRERPLWQGLAQAAVALTHLRRGNQTGASRLALRAQLTLRDCRPDQAPAEAVAWDTLGRQLAAIAEGRDDGLQVLR